MNYPPFEILYEDAHLLGVNKPAGIATMGVTGDKRSVVGLLRLYLQQRDLQSRPTFLGVVSRLDTPVTGILLLAKDPKTAEAINRQFRERLASKRYWALVERAPQPPAGQWEDWLRPSRRRHRVEAAEPEAPEARGAITKYQLRGKVGEWFLVDLRPVTGRKHQLRFQLALHGCPVVGDRKYGARTSFPVGVALHALELQILHPKNNTPLRIWAPLPPIWRRLGVKEALEEIPEAPEKP
jgi:23S rRNA pseudouridine1911/1915/1917 synthase